MLFKRKFFLDLDAEAGKTPAPPAVVAPVAAKPAPTAQPAGAIKPRLVAPSVEASTPAEASAATGQAAPRADAVAAPSSQASGLTTAEVIAAELAAELANRPAPTQATFAPEFLTPGASPLRRRRAGADLGRFRQMAGGILRS